MRKIPVKHKQSLFDIAIQEYGSVEAVIWLVEDNASLYSTVDSIEAGEELWIRNERMNVPVQEALTHYEIVSGGQDTHPEGIGFWTVEKDFICSA